MCFTQLRPIQDRYVRHTTHMRFKEWYRHQWSYRAIELRTIERFCEDVRLLVVRVNEFKTYDFIFHQIMDEVIENLYVFGLWVLNRILGKIYGTSVVTKHTHRFLKNPIVMKKFLHPKMLSTTTPSSYILGFSCI